MNDQNRAILWAREIIAHPDTTLILDTETTGLDWGREIVQIAIIDATGKELLNTLVKPIRPIPPTATAIHHITDEKVKNAPSWPEIWPQILKLIQDCEALVIYNAAFDVRMIHSTNSMNDLTWSEPSKKISCAMLEYAAFYGEWSNFHHHYKWLPLHGGDHTALGDCKATLERLRGMANSVLQQESPEEV